MATDAEQVVPQGKKCDNCEVGDIQLYCHECRKNFCNNCDFEIHRPAKMRSHSRKARFPKDITDMLIKTEKEGKMSDYSQVHPDGKEIRKYILETEDGYWYLFKNSSKDQHLETELDFELQNMHIQNFEKSKKLRISLPPQSLQYVYVSRINDELECGCDLTQRLSLGAARPGAVPRITEPDIITSTTPVDELRSLTEKMGSVSDYSKTDVLGADILQYYLEFPGGYAYLWMNQTKEVIFESEVEFTLENLEIAGRRRTTEKNNNKVILELKPGESEFVVLREVDHQLSNKMGMKAKHTLSIEGDGEEDQEEDEEEEEQGKGKGKDNAVNA